MRNDYTLLNYPYVEIEINEDESIIVKLRYANSYGKPFEIGEEVFVFWNNGELLYWNAYDKGIYKYLPDNWKFK